MVRIPDWAKFAEQIEQFFGAHGVAEVLDKERSGGAVSWVFCLAEIGGGIAVSTDLFTSGASLEFLLIAWLVFFRAGGLCVVSGVDSRGCVLVRIAGWSGRRSSTRAVGLS